MDNFVTHSTNYQPLFHLTTPWITLIQSKNQFYVVFLLKASDFLSILVPRILKSAEKLGHNVIFAADRLHIQWENIWFPMPWQPRISVEQPCNWANEQGSHRQGARAWFSISRVTDISYCPECNTSPSYTWPTTLHYPVSCVSVATTWLSCLCNWIFNGNIKLDL